MAKTIQKKAAPKAPPKKAEIKKQPGKNYGYFAICGVFMIIGAYSANTLKWVGDDIFIVMRYIENFLNGDGLVYNIGERVEGFTDFLWVMVLSLFQWMKFEPVETCMNLGIVCYVVTLFLYGKVSYRLGKKFDYKFFVPFTLIALVLNYDFGIWATSGMETSFYTMLLSAAFVTYFFTSIERKKRLILAGLFLCLAMMTRPDAMLLVLYVNVVLLARNIILKAKLKDLVIENVLLMAAVVCIYVPYFLWRYNYYGFIFPNTYYDKLGDQTFIERGLFYVKTYLQTHFTALLFFIFIPVFAKFLSSKASGANSFRQKLLSITADSGSCAFVVATGAVLAYICLFVIKVGGDFMYARFIIPCVPLIYFVIEYGAYQLAGTMHKTRAYALFTVVLLLGFYETSLRKEFFMVEKGGRMVTEEKQGIADERYVYKYEYIIDNDKKIGKLLQPYFKDLDAKILVKGGQACFAYYGKFKYCQEYHGLTDTLIAHSPVLTRGAKVGHEKNATMEYLEQKGVNFVFRRSPFKKQQYRFTQFNLTNTIAERAEILSYNRKLISQLKERFGANFIYTDFEAYLDNYISTQLPAKTKEEVKNDYAEFKAYYFLHNDDKAREEKFLEKINS